MEIHQNRQGAAGSAVGSLAGGSRGQLSRRICLKYKSCSALSALKTQNVLSDLNKQSVLSVLKTQNVLMVIKTQNMLSEFNTQNVL